MIPHIADSPSGRLEAFDKNGIHIGCAIHQHGPEWNEPHWEVWIGERKEPVLCTTQQEAERLLRACGAVIVSPEARPSARRPKALRTSPYLTPYRRHFSLSHLRP